MFGKIAKRITVAQTDASQTNVHINCDSYSGKAHYLINNKYRILLPATQCNELGHSQIARLMGQTWKLAASRRCITQLSANSSPHGQKGRHFDRRQYQMHFIEWKW